MTSKYLISILGIFIISFFYVSLQLQALEFESLGEFGFDADRGLTMGAEAIATSKNGPFSFNSHVRVSRGGSYPGGFQETFFGGIDVQIIEGGFGYQGMSFGARMGIFPHFDVIRSPYSLFINGNGISAPILELSYKDGPFSYINRWVDLNKHSRFGWPDRGAVWKSYALDLKGLRLGFQDVAVFTSYQLGLNEANEPIWSPSRAFDFSYFISPLPSYFTQHLASAVNRPWSTLTNDNSIMGFFCEYAGHSAMINAQILIDDLNMNRFLNPSGEQNPDKVAWSLGASIEGVAGKLELHHAGATAYTFEAYGRAGVNTCYGYSYYPADSFPSGEEIIPIPTALNMIGYRNGENNLAFLLGWERTFGKLALRAEGEFVLSGSQATGNPWHEFSYYAESSRSTRLLDDPVLEKKLIFRAHASYPWKDFRFGAALSLGGIWNRLALRTVDSDAWENQEPYYAPSGEHALVFKAGINLTWKQPLFKKNAKTNTGDLGMADSQTEQAPSVDKVESKQGSSVGQGSETMTPAESLPIE